MNICAFSSTRWGKGEPGLPHLKRDLNICLRRKSKAAHLYSQWDTELACSYKIVKYHAIVNSITIHYQLSLRHWFISRCLISLTTSRFTQIVECPSWHTEKLHIYQSSLFRVTKYLFLHLHDEYYVIFNVIPPTKEGEICNSIQYFC